MAKPDPIKLVFKLEQETKNKMRLQEVAAAGADKDLQPVTKDKAVVEKLYVSKAALKRLGNPDVLHVTIQVP